MDKFKTRKDTSLKNKFRFVVLNDATFEEKFSLTLTRSNVWLFLSTIAVILIMLTASAIIYTPLKYFIPGFGDFNYRGDILNLKYKTDSLENAIRGNDMWVKNLEDVIAGKVDTMRPAVPVKMDTKTALTDLDKVSQEEMDLRKSVEEADNFSISSKLNKKSGNKGQLGEFHFFPPVQGYVTDEYDAKKEHFGIDIAAPAESPVKATLDGTVVAAFFSFETGYVIAVQHKDNLISFYKHNAHLFKQIGNFVQAGDVIATVGNTGEFSSGPHVHFELWHNGQSLNPKDLVIF